MDAGAACALSDEAALPTERSFSVMLFASNLS
jgi:hypothetical protein